MSWAEGFPGVVADAQWIRRIQTGTYEFHLNTETLSISHLGAVPRGMHYEKLIQCGSLVKTKHTPAELELTLRVNEKEYHCHQGGKWSRFSGPRVIESGRFMQRADITDLVFKSSDGEILNAEARFETVAWPDRLGLILYVRMNDAWQDMSLGIQLNNPDGALEKTSKVASVPGSTKAAWHKVALVFDPVTMVECQPTSPVKIQATEMVTAKERPVKYDASLGWHRIDLDGVVPVLPKGGKYTANDAVERIRLVLSNPSDKEELARLMFAKTAVGFRQSIGSAVTGISAILRDCDGNPTGIPVQLCKNWHNDSKGGVYRGMWFHGITQMRVPPASRIELELTISYGHWGGVAAASHAQLSLIGWGSNQLWEQSALGAWGESICYEPSQAQANCTITDVRPLMVSNQGEDQHWKWTNNVGGGDFFRFFDSSGTRAPHSAMQAIRHKQGPCLTEVTYAGKITKGIRHASTVSLARTDDMVRGVYKIRLYVSEPTDFSRLVLFQAGADTYSYTAERKMAMGNETGMLQEWNTQWGDNVYRHEPIECAGRVPWVSLHQAVPQAGKIPSPWANRGLVIRSWKARLGGREAAPWIAERGTNLGRKQFSTVDILPPPNITRLEPGDFVEATIEHVVVPQSAKDYYGPNQSFRTALGKDANTWKMIFREAVDNDIDIVLQQGTLVRKCPDIRVMADKGNARFTLTGGLGYIPITFDGLASAEGGKLLVNGQPLNQSVHGKDFWQTDYDPRSRKWSRTYNIPAPNESSKSAIIQFISS